jgi:DNA repair exonuclease SbcCD ATPase subunit
MNNIVGKMLIVMQLVFSILFMCFAGAVYTFQGQWRTTAQAAQKQLEDARQQTEDANAARDREVKFLTGEFEKAETARKNLQAEIQNLRSQAETSEKLLASASQERDKAMADSDAATTEAADRVVAATELNKEVESLRKRIGVLIKEIQDTEDQLLARSGEVASAVEMEDQHLSEIARLKDLLRLNDIDPQQAVVGMVPGQVDKVDGFVQRTQRNQARTQEFLEITIGSDDKIFKDMTLTVSRENNFLCQARVVKVYPDTAVCLVKEETRQGTIQRGDNVTTKL